MKKSIILSAIAISLLMPTHAQIEMNSSGNVSIGGSTPSSTYKLITDGPALFKTSGYYGYGLNFVVGYATMTTLQPKTNNYGNLGSSANAFYKIYSTNPLQTSDKRQKENFRSISGALDCVLNLKGWKYDLKLLEAHKDSMMESDILQFLDSDRKNKLGFVAQEVMEVLPEAVDYDSITDVYAIYYTHLLPILVEAIKEQQAAIEDLKQQIINSGSLKSAEISLTSSGDLDIDQQPTTLFQNAPNPFSEGTKIKYYLEEQVGTGTIFIYDMNGRQLRSNELHHKGSGEISINSGELDAGMYMYTLITDGQVVGTKQMILTK